MKKYKYQKIEGAPDWIPAMPVVKVAESGVVGVLSRYDPKDRVPYYVAPYGWAVEVTPVEVWEPEKGELVACWDSGMCSVSFMHYMDTVPDRRFQHGTTEGPAWSNIARIPDDLLLKDADLSVEWWEANAEKYEATT